MDTYRVGNHNPRNLYRDEQHFGVVFDPADGPLVVAALNGELPQPADSCTCPALYGSTKPTVCPVHQGRRARGPKPPPLGPGCICDGSGRTCPRHGAVM